MTITAKTVTKTANPVTQTAKYGWVVEELRRLVRADGTIVAMSKPEVLILQHAAWEKPGRILTDLEEIDLPTQTLNITTHKKPDMPDFNEVAGVVLMARLMAGMPSVGDGYEFDAITAVVVGGTSFLGGIGTVTGALVGSIIIGLINNILNLLHVSTQYQLIVKSVLIAVAVIIDIKTKENKKSQ